MIDTSNVMINERDKETVTDNSAFAKKTVTDERPEIKESGWHTMVEDVFNITNGGYWHPLTAIDGFQGQKILNYKLQAMLHTQPLKKMNFDPILFQLVMMSIPYELIWNERDCKLWLSQRDDPTEEAPEDAPYFTLPTDASIMRVQPVNNNLLFRPVVGTITHSWYLTPLWNESILSHFYPRPENDTQFANMKIYVLPIRAYKVGINRLFLAKGIEPPYTEYTDTIPTNQEIWDIVNFGMPFLTPSTIREDINMDGQWCIRRGVSALSYYTNVRFNVLKDNSPVDNTSLNTHRETQGQIDLQRRLSQVYQLTDEEVRAEDTGSEVASQNMPVVIAQKTVEIDIDALQATADGGDLRLGDDGAFSYTNLLIDAKVRSGYKELPNDRILIPMFKITSESTIKNVKAINKVMIATHWSERYRPAGSNLKDGVFNAYQVNGWAGLDSIGGFNRKYVHNLKMPHSFRGTGSINIEGGSLIDTGETRNDNFADIVGTDRGYVGIGSGERRLSSNNYWHLNGSRGSPIATRVDNTAWYMARRLQLNYPQFTQGISSILVANRRTEPTFFFKGVHSMRTKHPISEDVGDGWVNYGEE